MNRPSPSSSATLFKIGTKKKGNDGNIWIVSELENGIKRWKLYKKPTKKTKKNNKIYTIVFCEPFTSLGYILKIKKIKINGDMYDKLIKKPKRFINDGNAYLFGKLYPLDTYKKRASMMNDIAQVGFVDVTGLNAHEVKGIVDREYKFSGTNNNYNWDDINLLKKIKKEISPRIIFIGQTIGGDVGADLYTHLDKHNEIDSIIIDNYFFFKQNASELRNEIAKKIKNYTKRKHHKITKQRKSTKKSKRSKKTKR